MSKSISGIDYSKIENLHDLHDKQMLLQHKIEIKREKICCDYTIIKQMLNPINYIARVCNGIYSIENIIVCAAKGYEAAKSFIAKWNMYK